MNSKPRIRVFCKKTFPNLGFEQNLGLNFETQVLCYCALFFNISSKSLQKTQVIVKTQVSSSKPRFHIFCAFEPDETQVLDETQVSGINVQTRFHTLHVINGMLMPRSYRIDTGKQTIFIIIFITSLLFVLNVIFSYLFQEIKIPSNARIHAI